MDYPSYPEYKDSGVDWLGEVPAHWEVRRLGNIGGFTKGGGFSKSDLMTEGVDAIIYGDIYTRFEIRVSTFPRKVSPDIAANSTSIFFGDILFTGSGETIEDIGKCVAYLQHQKCVAGGDIIVLKRPQCDSLFLSFMMNSSRIRTEKAKTGKGEIIVHAYASKLKDIRLPLPPLLEQKAIAAFLDAKTAQIDQAIAQNERMVALLRERQQIVVQEAVTKGLDPQVKMKDSGVDWIGKVPAHWEVKAIKYVLRERNERSDSGEEPLFMVSQKYGLVLRSEFHQKEEVAKSKIGAKIAYPNDLVFNKLKAHLGVFFKSVLDFKGLVSPDYAVYYSVEDDFDTFFLEKLFRHTGYIREFSVRATGIVEGLTRLYTGDLFDIKVALPPTQEIEAIVAHIEAQAATTDRAISLLEQQNDRLKEYKTVLIDRAVTGKINVTAHAPLAPNE